DELEFSVGGGEAEARVASAARALLEAAQAAASVAIDLSGQPGSAGVCGGRMRVALRRWHGAPDAARAAALAQPLASGCAAPIAAAELGDADGPDEMLMPNERLLIVGAGHCGHALAALARPLGFDVWMHDTRA